ncbi:MAG: hypothetical protein HY961_08635 [Ignavibacteriae bacterium]|nr:hypothetical protein [Ignavibacteriota bacterium]
MKLNDPLFIALVNALIAALLALNGCAGSVELINAHRTIVVDGDNSEWANIPGHAENNKLNVSACTDDEFLYVCLSSSDRATKMGIMRAGLMVWIDREGGKGKTFGINFPFGGMRADPPMMRDGDPNGGLGGESNGEPNGEMQHTIESQMNELDIVGPGKKDRYRVSTANTGGIQAKIGRVGKETMVYELRVPLKKTSQRPRAVEAIDGKNIGIGFETGELSAPQSPRRGGFGDGPGDGGKPGDGMPPHGGGGPPRGGGRPGGMPSGVGGRPESIDLWTVLVASNN